MHACGGREKESQEGAASLWPPLSPCRRLLHPINESLRECDRYYIIERHPNDHMTLVSATCQLSKVLLKLSPQGMHGVGLVPCFKNVPQKTFGAGKVVATQSAAFGAIFGALRDANIGEANSWVPAVFFQFFFFLNLMYNHAKLPDFSYFKKHYFFTIFYP